MTNVMDHEVKIRGISLNTFLQIVKCDMGPDAYDALIDNLIPEFKQAVAQNTLDNNTWYPLFWHSNLHDTAWNQFQVGVKFSHNLGYLGTKSLLTTKYKVIAKLLSPQTMLSIGLRLLDMHYQGVHFQIFDFKNGFGRGLFYGFQSCHKGVWHNISGCIEAIAETAGAQNIRIKHIKGGGDKDDSLEMEITWQ